jgi:AraC-like DNA-binding protein
VAAPPAQRVQAWRPDVPGIAEVLHARFTDHAYPVHTHDTWTLLIVDDGAIAYDLDRQHHGALRPQVTLLPPHVTHDGRSATSTGFRKRVLYLEPETLGVERIGAAVDAPSLPDSGLRQWIHRLHQALSEPGDAFAAQTRFALVCQELLGHLGNAPLEPPAPVLARRLRELLDDHVVAGIALSEAAQQLQAHPGHLVRSFTARYGVAPHAYLTGRRVDAARRLLLAGVPAAEAATAAGFYDQAHLTRHFRRYLGVTPGRYAAGVRRAPAAPAHTSTVTS